MDYREKTSLEHRKQLVSLVDELELYYQGDDLSFEEIDLAIEELRAIRREIDLDDESQA